MDYKSSLPSFSAILACLGVVAVIVVGISFIAGRFSSPAKPPVETPKAVVRSAPPIVPCGDNCKE